MECISSGLHNILVCNVIKYMICHSHCLLDENAWGDTWGMGGTQGDHNVGETGDHDREKLRTMIGRNCGS